MSRYSGKCDFRDCLEINFKDDWNDFISRAEVYHYTDEDDKEKLEFKCPADLIPWYTYIIASAAYGREGPCTIYLSKEDYLDETMESFKKFNFDTSYYEDRKALIKKLYLEEKAKPYGEQRII